MDEIGVAGVRVGHWTDEAARTGCTVVDLPEGTVGSYEARGGAPASREVDVLSPDKAVSRVDGVLLTGGSAFGLAAADGVMRHYEELGRGVATPGGPVPIVPTLALFDLAVGDPTVRPRAEDGYAAAQATRGPQTLRGRIGAGAGAHVGHWRGPEGRRPGGLAYAERRLGDLVVGVLCAVNAFGDIDHGDAEVSLESVRDLVPPFDVGPGAPEEPGDAQGHDRTHTTIGVVLTNARLDKTGCRILAQGAHDGLSRAITPPHTRFDGDAFVAVATGRVAAHVDTVRLMALAATVEAIRSV